MVNSFVGKENNLNIVIINGSPRKKGATSSIDIKLNKKVVTLSKKYYLDIKNKRNHPVQAIIYDFIFKVGIKSFVKRKGDKYRGVIEKWKNMDILI